MRAKKFYPLAAGALGLALITGCGATDPYAAADPQQEQPPVESENENEGTDAVDSVLDLALRGHEALGELVTDAAGHTLYRFDEDTPDQQTSECYEDCAEDWIPVAAAEEMSIPGGDERLDSFDREDGIEQVTLGGWPLYRHAGDAAPGDTNGEGAGDVWHAASPLGTKAEDEAWTEGYCPQGFEVRQDPELGATLVDDEGFTLYRFEEDSADPPEATCFDDCAEAWPPVLAMDEFTFQEGLDAALFDEVERENRLSQVTLNGWALYRFAEDEVPGDVNGHGVDDIWFAVTPNGEIAGDGDDAANDDNGEGTDGGTNYGDDNGDDGANGDY